MTTWAVSAGHGVGDSDRRWSGRSTKCLHSHRNGVDRRVSCLHMAGGCQRVLAMQRMKCEKKQHCLVVGFCNRNQNVNLHILTFPAVLPTHALFSSHLTWQVSSYFPPTHEFFSLSGVSKPLELWKISRTFLQWLKPNSQQHLNFHASF